MSCLRQLKAAGGLPPATLVSAQPKRARPRRVKCGVWRSWGGVGEIESRGGRRRGGEEGALRSKAADKPLPQATAWRKHASGRLSICRFLSHFPARRLFTQSVKLANLRFRLDLLLVHSATFVMPLFRRIWQNAAFRGYSRFARASLELPSAAQGGGRLAARPARFGCAETSAPAKRGAQLNSHACGRTRPVPPQAEQGGGAA